MSDKYSEDAPVKLTVEVAENGGFVIVDKGAYDPINDHFKRPAGTYAFETVQSLVDWLLTVYKPVERLTPDMITKKATRVLHVPPLEDGLPDDHPLTARI